MAKLSKHRSYRCMVIGKAGKISYDKVVPAIGEHGEELHRDEVLGALKVLVPNGVNYMVSKC